MSQFLSKQFYSIPSIPHEVDDSGSITPSVSANHLGGGVSGAIGEEEDKSAANFVYWSSGVVDMRYETSRIKSFGDSWPHDFLPPERLARAGFFYLNVIDRVQCPFCGLKIDGWGREHDPVKEHRRWQPGCPFILGIPCGNAVSGYHVGNDGYGRRVTQESRAVVATKKMPAKSGIVESDSSERYLHNAVWTTLRQPRSSISAPQGEQQRMDSSVSRRERPQLSTRPQLPKQQYALPPNSISQYEFRDDWSRPRSLCIPKEAFAVQRESYERPKSVCNVVRPPDKILVRRAASQAAPALLSGCYYQFELLPDRLESFASWPSATEQMPYVLAEAGFYYSGFQDVTICFSCGGGLRNWVKGADPWVEHARWYSQCSFLRATKGDPYVTWVVRNNRAKVTLDKVMPYVASPKIFGSEEKHACNSQPNASIRREHPKDQFDFNYYYMGNSRRGKFLIFKNDHFENNAFLPHNSSSSDLKNLTNVFTQLNFEVFVYENLRYKEIISVLKNVAQEDHSDVDCFGMAVFSRGRENEVLAAYDRLYFASDLYTIFGGSVSCSLAGKPKIFFFNVNDSDEVGLSLQSATPKKDLLEPDFLVVFTSWNDKISWKNTVNSYVQRLCEDLRINGPRGEDLLSILKRVGYKYDNSITASQKCKFKSSLRKIICFHPKVW